MDAHCTHFHSQSCTSLFTRTTYCLVFNINQDRGRHSHFRTSGGGGFTFGVPVLSVSLQNVVLEGYTFMGERSMHLNLTPDARSPKEAIHAKSQSLRLFLWFQRKVERKIAPFGYVMNAHSCLPSQTEVQFWESQEKKRKWTPFNCTFFKFANGLKPN